MIYKLSTIAKILGLDVDAGKAACSVNTLLTDSRDLTDASKTVFFAIRTSGNDGHNYIHELYERGVRFFVVETIPLERNQYDGAVFMKVPDVVNALQKIGAYHRARFDAPIVAITGSAGKTIVKEWLFQMLHHIYSIVRSPRSYNSQIGVPLSVWGMSAQTTLGIFEAGISRRGEMESLARVLKPTVGVLTSLTDEHDEGFDSRRQKCIEKVRLLQDCNYVVYRADDAMVREVVEYFCSDCRIIGWSNVDKNAPLYISSIIREGKKTRITYHYSGGISEVCVPFTASVDIIDAIHCLAVCLCLGVPADYVDTRMAMLSPVDTRLNVIEGVNNCMLVYDAYTTDFASLNLAIDFMNRRRTAMRKHTVIISDPQHEDVNKADLYRACARCFKDKGVSRLIGVGAGFMRNREFFNELDARFFNTTDELLETMSPGDFSNEFILIKGGPRFHFERISEMLESRHQETVLEVNLDALVHNFNYYRSLLPPQTGLVGMVKASAYGAGSLEVSKTLQSQGASYLAVAVLDEGVTLREAGVTMPIMVLNPRVLNYRTLFAYDLEPEIYNFEILEQVISEGRKCGVDQYPVHIKLDTGMHRLGFVEKELPKLIEILENQEIIRVASVFSHLATADCLDEDEYTCRQLATFDRCFDMLAERLPYYMEKHILNTAGIQRFGMSRHDDMARLGLGLYGIDPLEGINRKLRPVAKLTTIITALRTWPEGITVGYSRRGTLARESVIATLPIGYADGLNRHLGNGNASFYVNGHRAPTVGNICMDSCMIDVTGIQCSIGDTVEIFGPNVPVTELASILDTIPYEVLTSVSVRVKRVYYRE